MQEIVACCTNLKFDIEVALEQQLGAFPLPFPGMDKSGSAVCTFYIRSVCNKGTACPFRHVKGDRSVVCKHWLRGLCKKGDDCEFLHEYDMSRMPECYFFSKFGLCSNKECPFLHIDPEKKMKDCPWYDRGYCRHGPSCKNRHVRRVMCQNYLCGLCLDGPECKYVHPKFDLPPMDPTAQMKKGSITCHYCGEVGHKAVQCPKLQPGPLPAMASNATGSGSMGPVGGHHRPMPPHMQPGQDHRPQLPGSEGQGPRPRRPLDEVTCFKCGEKGHYANKCPKGHLAFLSNTAGVFQAPPPRPPNPTVTG